MLKNTIVTTFDVKIKVASF